MTTPRWYMVNEMGMATLCSDKDGAEKEEADAQMAWPHMGPHRAVQLVEAADVEAMRAGYAAARLEIESLRGRAGWVPAAAAQQPGTAGIWEPLPGTLPEPEKPVLLDIGKKYPIRAMWAAKHTLEVGMDDDSGFGEYDETTDTYYCPEDWYEWNEHEDVHWRVTETPRAWAPLPPTTSAGSGKGE